MTYKHKCYERAPDKWYCSRCDRPLGCYAAACICMYTTEELDRMGVTKRPAPEPRQNI